MPSSEVTVTLYPSGEKVRGTMRADGSVITDEIKTEQYAEYAVIDDGVRVTMANLDHGMMLFPGAKLAQPANPLATLTAERDELQRRVEALEATLRTLHDGGKLATAMGCQCTLTRFAEAAKEEKP